MLGEYIRITIDGQDILTEENGLRLLTGQAKELNKRGKPPVRAFVVSEMSLRGIVKLRVIAAIFNMSGGVIGYVAAPEKVYAFEPELKKMLTPHFSESFRLTCLHEKSCGAVIFRRRSGNIEFLLIKNKKGGNWGFPKGHVENGESEIDTAQREVFEETGLRINIIGGFRVTSDYRPRGRIFKQVVFFIAEMPDNGHVNVQQSEVDRHIWADYGLAMKTFRFNNDRNVLTHAKTWLTMN